MVLIIKLFEVRIYSYICITQDYIYQSNFLKLFPCAISVFRVGNWCLYVLGTQYGRHHHVLCSLDDEYTHTEEAVICRSDCRRISVLIESCGIDILVYKRRTVHNENGNFVLC